MRIPVAARLRSHWQIFVIAPLVIIVMTWPTFAHIFDGDEFWLHIKHRDEWLNLWNTWHVERVLSGQSEYFYTDSIFHPTGLSLAFKHIVLPHALLSIVLQRLMPADDVYNLLFLLTLWFNAVCTYALIRHLIRDNWISLFGALVVGLNPHLLLGSTTPDLILIGTLPLTIYFLHRAVHESRKRFAALAGLCLGISAFIGMYIFGITLLTASVYALSLSTSRWKLASFWRQLGLIVAVCGLLSAIRVYPMIADRAILEEGLSSYGDSINSYDLVDFFVNSVNPFTAGLLHNVFNFSPDLDQKGAYLGYICLFFMGCAILHKPLRRRMLPWLALLLFFAIMRLGQYLTFNDAAYPGIILPERALSDWFPALFGAVGLQEYYQPGVIVPLAILSSYGLAALLNSKPAKIRILVVTLSAIVLAIEFYVPLDGQKLEQDKTAYINWLRSESVESIKLINLPGWSGYPHYYLYLQTLTGYPHAYGFSSRNPQAARRYVQNNLLLRNWDNFRSVHCLPHNERSFTADLQQLLTDGFTHVVLHNWLYGDQFVKHSFWNLPPAYDDGAVSVYRLRDMQNSCQNTNTSLPRFYHFAASPAAIPGPGSSILSLHPSERIDSELFTYLGSLFSDWRRLIHFYQDEGKRVMQSGDRRYTDLDAVTKDNQVLYVLYNKHDTDPGALIGQAALDEFALCLSDERDDGSVIEQYVRSEFSCALVTAPEPLQVDYDNGARLENGIVEMADNQMDIQLLWSGLPSEPHSVSIQLFDIAGAKVLGHDSVIGDASLNRFLIDISALAAGEYVVKLVVYNYNTGHSAPGTARRDGRRFDRELVIATIDRA